MKKYVLMVVPLIPGNWLNAQYKPIDSSSSIHFVIKNFGIKTDGSFTGLQGNISFDTNHPTEARFIVSVDANTVNTGNDLRDNHLRNETYFDVKKYPRIQFTSTKVVPASKKPTLFLFGRLTIKNCSRDISFPFTATATKEGYFFEGSFTINRKDYNIGSTSTISDSLEVHLKILAGK